jgi:glycerol-3-phosphate dehydrogenase
MTAQRIQPFTLDGTFDLIVVGAGINGAGLARDAAMRGLRVLLIDKSDIGSGTTAGSTRLIHGGLRYLEHGELGLVRESLRERETLLRIAPHLIQPLPLLVPIYRGARRGSFKIRLGMIAYDLLSYDKSLPRHRMLSANEALQLAPGLQSEGLTNAALFHDTQAAFAERVAVENAISARAFGAQVVTHARVNQILVEDGSVRGVEFTDLLEGKQRKAFGSILVNAAGPWADEVLSSSRSTLNRRLIGGTKGSHLVVARFPRSPQTAMYAEAKTDGRPFFIIPWDGKFLIGTTDKRFDADLDRVEIDDDEVDYLLSEANSVLPSAELSRGSVLYSYSAVRPLPFAERTNEAAITRRHFVHEDFGGIKALISIAGGKLTTYRSLAEETVDLVFKKLNRTSPRSATATTPLPGADTDDFDSFAAAFKAASELPHPISERLLHLYGVRAVDVARLAHEDPRLATTLCEETGSILAQVVYAFRHEHAETLQDCLLRRTMVGLNSQVGLNAIERAARTAQEHLGWDDERVSREIAHYRGYVERFHPRCKGPS